MSERSRSKHHVSRPTLALGATLGLLFTVGQACGPADPPAPSGTGGSSATGGTGGARNGGSGVSNQGTGGSNQGSGGSGGSSSGTGGSTATGGTTGTGGSTGGGAEIALPMAVTSHFDNQGWFADPSIESKFGSTPPVIQQAASSSGPCATRQAGAQGRCLKIVYTPPAGASATGGWVGVFFLPTVTKPGGMVKAGDANWGVEPGKKVAAGAKSIKLWAAAEAANTKVEFKAGTSPGTLAYSDEFTVAASPQTLGTSWQQITLPITGTYGGGVLGAFAWVITETTKPATFYLDGIVWE